MEQSRQLLLHVPEIALPFEPLELAEGRRGVLVQAHGDGLGLFRLAHQNRVAPQHDRHVLDLVTVNPRQYLGSARVSGAVRDSVQGVKMDWFLFPQFVRAHPNPVRPDGQPHLETLLPEVAPRPYFGHCLLRASVTFRRYGHHAAQVPHVVNGVLLVELHLLPFRLEDVAHPLQGAVGKQVGAGAQEGGEDGVVGQTRT
uniref:Uncharacterized protein n=1 Tax=Neogobius melanostomus TaxID=47308 RepID=A0A8C6WT32_9GOBI